MRKLMAIKLPKFFIALLPLVFSLQVVACAQSFEEQYGQDLKGVPFDIRVTYMNQTGKAWADTTYQQRYDYLWNRYQKQLAEDTAQMAKESDDAIRKANKEMSKEIEKQNEIQKQYDKDLKKMNEKIAEDNKKNARFMRSMDQKQKLMMLRQASDAQRK